ncbi:MAG: hypothetical protein IPK85_15585 [Gemmatimonadetes bacterium]|nr:hypothetical protein [Gemmatimonadota bacterium]
MDVTPADREELVRRVLQRAGGGTRRHGKVREAGAATGGTVVPPAARTPGQLVILHAESTPDLASRWRRALPPGVDVGRLAVATEGRHTVVIAEVPEALVAAARQAGLDIGAQCSTRAHE